MNTDSCVPKVLLAATLLKAEEPNGKRPEVERQIQQNGRIKEFSQNTFFLFCGK